MPIDPESVQVWQGSSQAALQQTPRAHQPESHSSPLWQVRLSRRPHDPATHVYVGAQSESPAQASRQSWVSGSQVNGAQTSGAQSSQRPAVSQRLSPVDMPSAQVGWPQSVPDGRGVQVP